MDKQKWIEVIRIIISIIAGLIGGITPSVLS